MPVVVQNGLFVAKYPYAQKDIPKQAGFKWHDPNGEWCKSTRFGKCPACTAGLPKNWWTDKPAFAARLRKDCSPEALELMGEHIEAVDASKAVDADVEIPRPDGLDYLPYQRGGIAYAMGRKNTLIADEMGLGKGQPVDSMVLCPGGWRRIGDVAFGDEVIGSDGNATKITGIFHRGILPIYRVTFNDRTSVLVDGDHLWAVRTNNDQYRSKPWRTMQTRGLIGTLYDGAKNRRWRIPMVQPVQFHTSKELPVDPYLLGVLLGDGHLAHHPAAFTSGDAIVHLEVEKILPEGVHLSPINKNDPKDGFRIVSEPRSAPNPVLDVMRSLGLSGVSADQKFVPREYLFASVDDRISLLQGLLDTDGELRPDHLEFSSSSEQLANAVAFITESLGGNARRSVRQEPKYLYKGEVRVGLPSHKVGISLPANICPVRAIANRWKPRAKYQPNRTISSIEPEGRAEIVCISVAADDHLYITEHCIVTHNTIQALGIINASPDCKNVLLVVPASLRLNWLREATKWLVRSDEFTPYVVDTGVERVKTGNKVEKTTKHRDGTTSTKIVDEVVSVDATIPETANLVIVNYDLLRGAMISDPEGKLKKDGKTIKKVWQPSAMLAQLMARKWDLLVVDECHSLKNPKSMQTKSILGFPGNKKKEEDPISGLVDSAVRKVFLTGTPILNKPIEMHPMLSALAPAEFGNFFAFVKRYCDARQEKVGWNKTVWKFDGNSNLAELQERLRSTIMVRRMKADVLKELPPKRRQLIVLPSDGCEKVLKSEQTAWAPKADRLASIENRMDLAHASGDQAAYNRAASELEAAESVLFEEISTARAEVARAKVPHVIAHVEELFTQGVEKVVVFGHHHDVCNAIHDHFGSASVKLTGEVTSDKARQSAVDRFQTDPAVKVFVGSIGAAGVGHTLTAASVVVFAELDWVPAKMSQAEDRLHRIGQLCSVLVQHLVLNGSLDQRMAELVMAKQAIADQALDSDTSIEVPDMPPVAAARQARPNKYPTASPEKAAAAHLAVRMLAGMCDGAQTEDERGFNKVDTSIGHKLAALNSLTDGQVWLASQFARKYKRQLPSDLLDTLSQ